ncbi:MAG: 50S ribosomal protein L29 [Bdellovibrionales bacterium]|jgi:large subunit ribosomal protein L29|nr:50S ribosomal protein L29 [Bdellovibrionales bacterium]MBT3526000.1 50S ribosomal protein L29 [Bdellovibrionales bacterium]MBT7668912.1 50S ribosomal protein L29 [Bdellovibrionales bacterium]MBT7767574.1 50S ribosomal protein L29 [Bdellovibrionales bacterium]
MLKLSEIKEWDAKLIESKVDDLRNELFRVRMLKKTSGVEKPHQIKDLKKDIARLLTVKNATSTKSTANGQTTTNV